MKSFKNNDYCDARLGNGETVKGWVICDRSGKPRYFQIEGRGGLCASIESLKYINLIEEPSNVRQFE